MYGGRGNVDTYEQVTSVLSHEFKRLVLLSSPSLTAWGRVLSMTNRITYRFTWTPQRDRARRGSSILCGSCDASSCLLVPVKE